MSENSDYRSIFGRDPEPWRSPLGALRLTLTGDPADVDVARAQHEVEELVKVMDELSKRKITITINEPRCMACGQLEHNCPTGGRVLR